jgi:hypothetical protein
LTTPIRSPPARKRVAAGRGKGQLTDRSDWTVLCLTTRRRPTWVTIPKCGPIASQRAGPANSVRVHCSWRDW